MTLVLMQFDCGCMQLVLDSDKGGGRGAPMVTPPLNHDHIIGLNFHTTHQAWMV